MKIHARELGTGRLQRELHGGDNRELFDVKGNEYSLQGERFPREQVGVFLGVWACSTFTPGRGVGGYI